MTANPDWEEVTASLPRDANGNLLQKAIDRPDIMARVFKLKLDAMLKDVFEKQIVGKVAGYAWTLEYQVDKCYNHRFINTYITQQTSFT
jgi:hypothetical protein